MRFLLLAALLTPIQDAKPDPEAFYRSVERAVAAHPHFTFRGLHDEREGGETVIMQTMRMELAADADPKMTKATWAWALVGADNDTIPCCRADAGKKDLRTDWWFPGHAVWGDGFLGWGWSHSWGGSGRSGLAHGGDDDRRLPNEYYGAGFRRRWARQLVASGLRLPVCPRTRRGPSDFRITDLELKDHTIEFTSRLIGASSSWRVQLTVGKDLLPVRRVAREIGREGHEIREVYTMRAIGEAVATGKVTVAAAADKAAKLAADLKLPDGTFGKRDAWLSALRHLEQEASLPETAAVVELGDVAGADGVEIRDGRLVIDPKKAKDADVAMRRVLMKSVLAGRDLPAWLVEGLCTWISCDPAPLVDLLEKPPKPAAIDEMKAPSAGRCEFVVLVLDGSWRRGNVRLFLDSLRERGWQESIEKASGMTWKDFRAHEAGLFKDTFERTKK